MDKERRNILKVISLIALLVIIDLLIKSWVANNFGLGQKQELLGSSFMLVRVDNLGMATRLNSNLNIQEIGGWGFKILSSVLFIKIFRKETLSVFKVSSTLILFGWIGNLLDRIFLSKGNQAYRFMDYFYENVLTNSVTNISSILSMTGWIILFIFIIVRFREFKKIFNRAGNKTETQQPL
jgi:lipoprotein signal peptidase